MLHIVHATEDLLTPHAVFSIAGQRPFRLLSHYSATKFAVRGFTQAFAMELAPHGIRVNAYCPGIHDTQMWKDMDDDITKITGQAKGEAIKSMTDNLVALKRTGTPEDVAKLVSFLASDGAEYMTGQSVIIDGGVVFS